MASSREYIDYGHLLSKKDVRDLVQESEAHVIQEITALVTSNAEIIGILEKLIKDIDRVREALMLFGMRIRVDSLEVDDAKLAFELWKYAAEDAFRRDASEAGPDERV